ncbi:FecR family protein [Roseivirga sp. E12]|uniref:FecR family protein n=1 Tax=Roseivirga sp. E12 TaxID=2819237 RepID=UPI001ABD14CD|nr:FecR domain-containing protein [Roseivirga sp. E12]MBO3698697.1 FecR domain-containing protein [Roseivirga sp. E12]
MKEKANISDHLLISYLNQSATAEESQQVEAWLAAGVQNQVEFDKVKLVWQHSENLSDFEAIDLGRNWRELQGKIQRERKDSGPKWQIWKYAAAVLLVATVSFLLFRPGPVEMQQAVASNGPMEVLLADGSVVWLNEGAVLDYPEEFTASTREVSLTGEAFFEVSHNPDKPFIVEADGTTTEVLGTSFTITEEDGEVLRLVLATGKVRFTKDNQQATLTPGQMIVVDANGKVSKSVNDNQNFMSWKTRKLTFDNTPMKEVISDISELYGVVLEIKDKEFLTCPMTTTFQDDSLKDVLETIELLFNIEIQQNGQLYQLIGKGCEQ